MDLDTGNIQFIEIDDFESKTWFRLAIPESLPLPTAIKFRSKVYLSSRIKGLYQTSTKIKFTPVELNNFMVVAMREL